MSKRNSFVTFYRAVYTYFRDKRDMNIIHIAQTEKP